MKIGFRQEMFGGTGSLVMKIDSCLLNVLGPISQTIYDAIIEIFFSNLFFRNFYPSHQISPNYARHASIVVVVFV